MIRMLCPRLTGCGIRAALAMLIAAAATVSMPALAAPLEAQVIRGGGPPLTEEMQQLRDASAREAAGDLEMAERLLRSSLDRNPLSLTALMSLERLIRMRGRVEELLPLIDLHLQADETSAIGHQMRVRALSSLERVEEIDKAADAWIRATPKVETPYREVARAWEQRGDIDRAVRALERGRERLGGEALALELGDLYARRGDVDRAAREWSLAVGRDAAGLNLMRRKLGAQADGGAAVLPKLLEGLVRSPTTPMRRRAAVELAIDAGLAERAETLAKALVPELKGPQREDFLLEVARQADGAGLNRMALWAYEQLLPSSGARRGDATGQMLAIRSRVAELALVLGDTARARAAYASLEGSFAEGSPEQRRAIALKAELTAREGKLDEAQAQLDQLRGAFPDAIEADAVAAAIAERLIARGDVDRAGALLTGITGPRSAMLRGTIALHAGDVTAARKALMSAAAGLEGATATRTIELVTLLGRVSPKGGRLLGSAIAREASGDAAGAVAELTGTKAAALAEPERAALLDHAASIAERGHRVAEAMELRRRIVTEHPQSQAAPPALLALSRWLAEREEGREEAKKLLERLILGYPRSALLPQARRELDQLQKRVPGT